MRLRTLTKFDPAIIGAGAAVQEGFVADVAGLGEALGAGGRGDAAGVGGDQAGFGHKPAASSFGRHVV